MSDNCGPKQYFDVPLARCMSCEDICRPIFDTYGQCIRECLDFALEEGYLVKGPIPPCQIKTEGLNPLYLIPIMFAVIFVTAIFVLFMEKKWNITAKFPCLDQLRLGGVQPEDRAQNMDQEHDQLFA